MKLSLSSQRLASSRVADSKDLGAWKADGTTPRLLVIQLTRIPRTDVAPFAAAAGAGDFRRSKDDALTDVDVE
jgi:hypothetical protein